MSVIDSWADLDFDETLFLSYVERMDDMIKSLTNCFGLDRFTFYKTFSDNNSDWYKQYLSEKLYLESIFELSANKYESIYFIWSIVTSYQNIINEASKFGIYQSVTVVNKVVKIVNFIF